MSARMDRKHVNTDATVKLDTSPGIPEVEVTAEAANDILSFLPEHIVSIYATDAEQDKKLEASRNEIKALRAEVYDLQKENLEADKFLLETSLVTKGILIDIQNEKEAAYPLGLKKPVKNPVEGYQ